MGRAADVGLFQRQSSATGGEAVYEEAPKHRRRADPAPLAGRFSVWWAASIVDYQDGQWREIQDRMDQAMDLLPGRPLANQPAVLAGLYQFDGVSYCFFVAVESTTPRVAHAVAIRALREALSSAGVALGHTKQAWSPITLDLDPSPLRLRPFDGRAAANELSPS